jgi:predicted lipid carrier protein YhbT
MAPCVWLANCAISPNLLMIAQFLHVLIASRKDGDAGFFSRLIDSVEATINEDAGMIFFCEYT